MPSESSIGSSRDELVRFLDREFDGVPGIADEWPGLTAVHNLRHCRVSTPMETQQALVTAQSNCLCLMLLLLNPKNRAEFACCANTVHSFRPCFRGAWFREDCGVCEKCAWIYFLHVL